MAWIESHIDLSEHPKVYGLISALNVRKPEAIGLLHLLWHFTMKFSWRNGDISKFNREIIAKSCGWDNDPNVFIDALITNGFLDNGGNGSYLQVHDWHDFAGRMVKDRLRYEKANKIRVKSVRIPQKSTEIRSQPNQPNLPNLTNLTFKNISEQVEHLFVSFDSNLQNKIKIYLDRVSKKNKSGIISEGKKLTLLNELFNTNQRFNDSSLLGYALDQAIARDACNIGYINAIIKNQKTKKPF